MAEDDLRDYLRQGPDRTTRELVARSGPRASTGASVLDIGGGIGAIEFELLALGAARVISVDASSAYVETARREAVRRGLADRIEHRRGDFVELAPEVGAGRLRHPRPGRLLLRRHAGAARGGRRSGRAGGRVSSTRGTPGGRGSGARCSARSRRPGATASASTSTESGRWMRPFRGAGFERRSIKRGAFWQVAVYDRDRQPTVEPSL